MMVKRYITPLLFMLLLGSSAARAAIGSALVDDKKLCEVKGPVLRCEVRDYAVDGPVREIDTYGAKGRMTNQSFYSNGICTDASYWTYDGSDRIYRYLDVSYLEDGSINRGASRDNGTITQYNAKGDMVHQYITDAQGELKAHHTYSYTYSKDGRKLRTIFSVYGPGGKLQERQIGSCTYGKAGRILSEVWRSVPGTLLTKTRYTWDKAGRKTVEEQTDGSGNLIFYMSWKYDGSGRLLQRLNGLNGRIWKENIKYAGDGTVEKFVRYQRDKLQETWTADPKFRVTYITDYSTSGRVVTVKDKNWITTRVVSYDISGAQLWNSRYQYEYDSWGNWIKRWEKGKEGNAVYRRFEYYPEVQGYSGLFFDAANQITDDKGNGLGGVALVLDHGYAALPTDSAGNWFYPGLSGVITVTPKKDGWTFEPVRAFVSPICPTIRFKAKKLPIRTADIAATNPMPATPIRQAVVSPAPAPASTTSASTTAAPIESQEPVQLFLEQHKVITSPVAKSGKIQGPKGYSENASALGILPQSIPWQDEEAARAASMAAGLAAVLGICVYSVLKK